MKKFQMLAKYESRTEQETNDIGHLIHQQLKWPSCVYLEGDLGAGKTMLCKSIIAAAGYSGVVTSPTYNLIQEYPVDLATAANLDERDSAKRTIYHMDLYRLNDAQELYYLGLADLWQSTSMFLVEWPEKGNGILQDPDYIVEITKKSRKTEEFREVLFYQSN